MSRGRSYRSHAPSRRFGGRVGCPAHPNPCPAVGRGDMRGQRAFTWAMRDVSPDPHCVPYHVVTQVTQTTRLIVEGRAELPAW
eukprot:354465-Chlamydomonas_euryale.AAC.4